MLTDSMMISITKKKEADSHLLTAISLEMSFKRSSLTFMAVTKLAIKARSEDK